MTRDSFDRALARAGELGPQEAEILRLLRVDGRYYTKTGGPHLVRLSKRLGVTVQAVKERLQAMRPIIREGLKQ